MCREKEGLRVLERAEGERRGLCCDVALQGGGGGGGGKMCC